MFILTYDFLYRLHRSASASNRGQGVVELFEEATIMFVNIANLATITANLYPYWKGIF